MSTFGDIIENKDSIEPVVSSGEYSPIPKGDYLAIVKNTEIKTAKSGGKYLSLDFEIIEGQFKSRRVFTNLTIKNDNPKAEQIGRGKLSALGQAVGYPGIPDEPYQLHDIELIISVKVKEAEGQYKASNDIVAFKAVKKTSRVIETQEDAAKEVFGNDDLPF